jgi:hypothetical protein
MDSRVDDSEQIVLRPILESARTIAAATTQIDLAMREAQEPVAQLAANISRIGLTIAALAAGSGGAKTDEALATLQGEIAKAITNLQFYDRMTQHLGHVHDYLGGIASQLAGLAEESRGTAARLPPELDAAAWDGLRERLFHRLISDPQRQLLEMMLPAENAGGQMTSDASREHYAAQGTVELF